MGIRTTTVARILGTMKTPRHDPVITRDRQGLSALPTFRVSCWCGFTQVASSRADARSWKDHHHAEVAGQPLTQRIEGIIIHTIPPHTGETT
jgi:hypothetical protein